MSVRNSNVLYAKNITKLSRKPSPGRVIFLSDQCLGQGPFSTAKFGGFGLWVRVEVLGSDCNNRFPKGNSVRNETNGPKFQNHPIST